MKLTPEEIIKWGEEICHHMDYILKDSSPRPFKRQCNVCWEDFKAQLEKLSDVCPEMDEVLVFIKEYRDNVGNIKSEKYSYGDQIKVKWQPLTEVLDSLTSTVEYKAEQKNREETGN